MKNIAWSAILIFLLLSLVFASGCGKQRFSSADRQRTTSLSGDLPLMGYAIQAGAFSNVENAVRLTDLLEDKGIDAYYFLYRSGHYKVRFGDFPSRESAGQRAENLKAAGVIEEYYIVRPESYTAAKRNELGNSYLRSMVVGTAESFLGIPYKWGGTTAEEGFDCSGLVMAVYRLNGLKLPRTSREQYRVGWPVRKENLKKGDLVFFATNGGRRVSHVGLYTGGGMFIHAPKKGENISVATLSTGYFKESFVGARTLLKPEG